MTNDHIFNKIAQALLVDYTSVYYVNAVTNEYQWYSADPEFHSLHIEQGGEDFFKNLIRDADQVVYEPDKHIFMRDIQKENLLAQMKKGTMQSIKYRLLIDGKPVYHSLRLIRGLSDDDDYFILGVLNIDKQERSRLEAQKVEQEREIFNQIAASLAEHYDTIYYIDIETSHYFEFSSTDMYKKLGIPSEGDDFFSESRKNIKKIVHPDDFERVSKLYYKDYMLENLKYKRSVNSTYRLVINGKTMFYRCSQIWASDKRHIIVCLENVDVKVSVETELKETRKKTITYGQIAESLASHYDVIYYIDSSSGNYAEFTSNSIYGSLEMQEEGNDFFADAQANTLRLVHKSDMERVQNVLKKDYLITALEDKKQFSTDYRLIVDGKTQYTRFTALWSSDKVHFIIGVENINEEVKKEKEQVKALNLANELARRDELTGVKNKKAYHELEDSVQSNIDNGVDYIPFAIVVCDINNLKIVNDTQGHKAGDEYIRAACRLICNIFTHSQVFRVGGDEFVAFLGSGDYPDRKELMEKLHITVENNLRNSEGPVVAAGIAEYDHENDKKISDVFERADSKMYEDKTKLKEIGEGVAAPENHSIDVLIPSDRKKKLQGLFNALSLASEGSYVYLCDMKYDFSIWSKTAVNAFGLPSEFMYRAGDLWEEMIHPDDRETYRAGINAIFTGDATGHDMQYRAKMINGEYAVCTCKGIVLRDEVGAPDYFGGIIRNHDAHSNIEELTGLRNQYGFFEDLQANMINKTRMNIVILGVSKFSMLNELYGYRFGNSVLQTLGRTLFERVGNGGSVYRLDGTKFAVLSTSKPIQEMKDRYSDLRTFCREKFKVEGKQLILELNAGIISVDTFNVDHQTVYTCLNYAYNESKLKKQGEIVEFGSQISDESKQRMQQISTIRESITQDCSGFYLLYQPVVDTNTQKLIGGEALLRWKNEEYGVVPPDRFIPVLERDSLFCTLGEWILRSALRDAKKMIEKDPEFIINVNLAYSQIEKPGFVDMVMHSLRDADFPAENLCLEITERCRLLDVDLLKNVIVNLRGRGVKIALDDFGTGFSSIGLAKDLSFDVIKIDRSFVRRIENDEIEKKLIEHFAMLAGIFSASICVEGIETAKMREIVQQYKVHSLQGYYYAKPLPLDDFLGWEHKD